MYWPGPAVVSGGRRRADPTLRTPVPTSSESQKPAAWQPASCGSVHQTLGFSISWILFLGLGLADEIAVVKCQSCENTQSKMPELNLHSWAQTPSKMPRPWRLIRRKMPMKLRSTVLLPWRWCSLTAARQIRHCSWNLLEDTLQTALQSTTTALEEIDQPMHPLARDWTGVLFHTRMQLCRSKIPRMKTKSFSNGWKFWKGNASCHWGPEKRYGSTTNDDDAAVGSLGSSSVVITRGRLEEEEDVPDSALGFADEEAPESTLGLAPTDADAETTWPLPSATHV